MHGFLLVRTRNRHLAEDLTQEVFTRALRRIDAFSWQGTAFAAWLTTIAKNLYLDELGRGPFVVYCEVGQRGHTATALLQELGLKARNLDGGLQTWSAWTRADADAKRGGAS